ncbi:unnamed protein product [Boreogadus saida]
MPDGGAGPGNLTVELQLDWLKGTRGGAKRVLFLDNQQHQRTTLLKLGQSPPQQVLHLHCVPESSTFLQEQAYILLDCGEDNLCIPDLQLSASMDRRELVICDENLVMLTITVLNQGEGAYETELHATLPAEADYIGVERRVEGLSRLNCEYRLLNDSRMVVCDLGNPMVSGTEVITPDPQLWQHGGPQVLAEEDAWSHI